MKFKEGQEEAPGGLALGAVVRKLAWKEYHSKRSFDGRLGLSMALATRR